MRVAIYARVSTDQQSNENQLRELRAYCAARGWTQIVIYQDSDISGTKISRPEFDRMLEAAKSKEIDAVMVWRFDRASRSTHHLLSLMGQLNSWGIEFISLREQIDTSTAAGKLMFTMVAAFAQFERDLISDRTKSAMERLKSEGKKVGRSRKIDHAEVHRLAKELSPAEVALKLGISASHCRKILAA